VLITGQVYLELSNLFRSGKRFEFHWMSFRPQTQDLLLRYDHPALLGSALDLGLAFSILKQDTTFLNRRFQAGIATRSYGSNSYRFFGDINSSRSIDAGDQITNFNMNYIGAGIVVNKLDRPRFPLSGFLVALDAAVGLKSIKSVSSDQGNSTQGKVDFSFNVYRPVGKVFQLFGAVAAGAILNNNLFINDAYRKGGLRSLRGFNENEFFATRYSTISVEFRTLLKGEGYLYTFYDQGFLLLDTVDRLNKDTPFGVGIGALLNAGAGKLNLAFAMGRSNVQPFSVDFSKLHFGYVVVF
jgi:outer membrane protein assembly factor BamA